jgi:hypothetical protein
MSRLVTILLIALVFGCKKSELKPSALFNYEIVPFEGTDSSKVNFTNTSENGSKYLWDFGDDSNVSELKNPSHVFHLWWNSGVQGRDYRVKLQVNGRGNQFDTATAVIHIPCNEPPCDCESTIEGRGGVICYTNKTINLVSSILRLHVFGPYRKPCYHENMESFNFTIDIPITITGVNQFTVIPNNDNLDVYFCFPMGGCSNYGKASITIKGILPTKVGDTINFHLDYQRYSTNLIADWSMVIN